MFFKDYIVVEVVNESEIIINYGLEDGAVVGQSVRIYEVGPIIKHPETGEELGTYDHIKGQLEVTTPFDKFSICKRIIRKDKNSFLTITALTGGTSKEIAKLNVDENDYTNRLNEFDKIIRPKDKVKILG